MIKLARLTRRALSGNSMYRLCLPPYETRKPEFGGALGRPRTG